MLYGTHLFINLSWFAINLKAQDLSDFVKKFYETCKNIIENALLSQHRYSFMTNLLSIVNLCRSMLVWSWRTIFRDYALLQRISIFIFSDIFANVAIYIILHTTLSSIQLREYVRQGSSSRVYSLCNQILFVHLQWHSWWTCFVTSNQWVSKSYSEMCSQATFHSNCIHNKLENAYISNRRSFSQSL